MKRVQIHGHRGSRGTHPENCLLSFKEAFAAGADFFELDTHLTKDEVPIVFHDAEVGPRVCLGQAQRLVRDLSMSELVDIDCGSVPQPNFPDQKTYPGEKIPTLQTVLEWVASTPAPFGVNIEIKMSAGDPGHFARSVLQLLGKFGLSRRAIVQSFDFRPLVETRRLDPKLFVSCLFERRADFVEEARQVGANAIGPHFSLLTQDIVERAHGAGLQVVPWTVNTEKEWEQVLALRVDGIITDYPRKLKAFLGGAQLSQ